MALEPGPSQALQASPRKDITTGQIVFLCVALFLKGGLLAAYIPFFTFWLSKKGYSNKQLGLISLVDAVATLFLPTIGGVLDGLRAHNSGYSLLLIVLAVLKLAYLYFAKNFMAIVVLTILTAPLLRAAGGLLDALALYAFHEKGNFARIRLVGDLGWGLIALGVGASIQAFGTEDAVFWIFAAICGVLAVIWLVSTPWMSSIRPDSKRMNWAEFMAQLSYLQENTLNAGTARGLVMLAFIGASLGLIATFEFVLLDRMMGGGLLMGLCKLTGTISAIPAWWFVTPAMDRYGIKNVQLGCLFFAGIRLLILGVMTEAWHALLSECLAGIGGFAAAYGSVTIFLGRLVEEDMKGTSQTVVMVVFTGIGTGAGPLIGSYIAEEYGLQTMFCCGAALVALTCAAVASYDLLCRFAFGTYTSLEDTCKMSQLTAV